MVHTILWLAQLNLVECSGQERQRTVKESGIVTEVLPVVVDASSVVAGLVKLK